MRGQAPIRKNALPERASHAYGDHSAGLCANPWAAFQARSRTFLQTNRNRRQAFIPGPGTSTHTYLRQLDPTYKHAAYKVDFLLRHFGAETTSNVIIEYDGFSEHFTHRDRVNAGNYQRYYKPEDVERQFVLESYGYRFLRVSRFNLGDDPVATLNPSFSTRARHHA